MNGYEATKQTRSLDNEYAKRLPIIAMSANANKEDAQESLASGMNRHVAKPFEPQIPAAELYKKVLRQQWSRPIGKNTGIVHGDEEEET